MLDKLKADFDGIMELVNKTPAPLQEMAFKMILEQWFSENTAPKTAPPSAPPKPGTPPTSGTVPDSIKPFLTSNAITTETLEKVFHPAGPGAQLLASSIPGNGKASKMVNLSLLLCVKQALESASFTCTMKELRERHPLRLLRLSELLLNSEGEQELLQAAGEGRRPGVERAGS